MEEEVGRIDVTKPTISFAVPAGVILVTGCLLTAYVVYDAILQQTTKQPHWYSAIDTEQTMILGALFVLFSCAVLVVHVILWIRRGRKNI